MSDRVVDVVDADAQRLARQPAAPAADDRLTRNFRRREFACKCGCGFDAVQLTLVAHLQTLRDVVGAPVRVLSGCRCWSHNKRVGGKTGSFHLLGKAADVTVEGMSAVELRAIAERLGLFGGIGVYPSRGFVHLDTRRKPGRWSG